MKNPAVKVGDKVRMLNNDSCHQFKRDDIVTVTKLDYDFDNSSFHTETGAYVCGETDAFELVNSRAANNSSLDSISYIIDESVWYGEPTPYPKSKPTQALGALIKVLVDKGLVTEDDFRNALLANVENVGEPAIAGALSSTKVGDE